GRRARKGRAREDRHRGKGQVDPLLEDREGLAGVDRLQGLPAEGQAGDLLLRRRRRTSTGRGRELGRRRNSGPEHGRYRAVARRGPPDSQALSSRGLTRLTSPSSSPNI